MYRTDIAEFLTAVIADRNYPQADRDRAASALQFYSEKIADEIKPSGSEKRDETERWVAEVFARMGASMLWDDPEDCMIQTKKDGNGITRRHVASRTYHDPSYKHYGNPRCNREPAPAPGPMPTFEPAVPLPVLPPSDIEKAAVKESFRSFDDRFSEAAVAARVAAIEREAAQIRALREQ